MLKLHNAMWPGLVGKGDEDGQEPPISLERMLELTAGAEVNGQKFDGIDYFLFLPHTDPNASDDDLRKIADLIAGHGFSVGSLVAPIWPGTVGDSAMGDKESTDKFLSAVSFALTQQSLVSTRGVRIPKRTRPKSQQRFETLRRSQRITVNVWPLRARFAGPACTAGRT